MKTNPSKSLRLIGRVYARGTSFGGTGGGENTSEDAFVGEDSAAFQLEKQSLVSWVYFSAILGVVLFALNVLWIDPSTGFGKAFVDAVSGISESHEVKFCFIYLFAVFIPYCLYLPFYL